MSLLPSDIKTFWPNGRIRTHEFCVDGVNSECKEWHENGQLWWHEIRQNGKLQGISRQWYENSKLCYHASYRDGKREGEHKEWHENGQLRWCGFYQNGKLQGEGVWIDEDGYIQRREYWINSIQKDESFTIEKKFYLLKLKHILRHKTYHRKYIPFLDGELIKDVNDLIIGYL